MNKETNEIIIELIISIISIVVTFYKAWILSIIWNMYIASAINMPELSIKIIFIIMYFIEIFLLRTDTKSVKEEKNNIEYKISVLKNNIIAPIYLLIFIFIIDWLWR